MTENEISYLVRGAIFKVYNNLGPGLFESVYESALFYELTKTDLQVQKQVEVIIPYEEIILDPAFRIDLLVENKVIIELKSVEDLAPIHYKQLSTYLRLTNKKLGLLVNFNTLNILDDIKRVANKIQ
ncbi:MULTISPECIES: GxxExxY protein [Flavobacterium]|jgi:GxxExxY protein|uniref:GxxExxY protein n=1 Tax=Flavobacterium pectinovorum TaxID=29533 RepID=A0AB36P2P4_9FLAO|nr:MULTISPECIES: GxxExxY protein [Flavobacterium]KIQ18072.1 GxxExxY protein [Flavobacterium sp. MEB061]OXB05974.1 GxxExxY protein [Flavobacterium pectinovorum]SHM19088.1 GxxExxY protein [Flavobacterium pectinovorum]